MLDEDGDLSLPKSQTPTNEDTHKQSECTSPPCSAVKSSETQDPRIYHHPYFPLTPKDSSPESFKSQNIIKNIENTKNTEPDVQLPVSSQPSLEQLAQLAQSAHLARIASSAGFVSPFTTPFARFNPFLPRTLLNPAMNPLLNLYGLNSLPANPAATALAESTSLYLRSREAINQQAPQHKPN